MQSLLLVQVIFSSLFFAAVFESQASSIPHSARLHRRFTFVSKATPSNWSTNSLEDYDQYHFRFLSIGCHKKRDQEDFFKECCHPRQKNETLENIPVECQLDPQSMVKAQEYILNSTLGKGEVESGIGRPVYVPKDSIKVLQPEKGRNSTQPPTKKQLDEILKVQAEIEKFNSTLSHTDASNSPASDNEAINGDTHADHITATSKNLSIKQVNTKEDNSYNDIDAKAQAAADYAAKAKADSDAALKAKADEETASKAAEAAKAKTDADAALRAKADADAASKAKSEADVAKAQSESSSSNSDTSNSATASNALSSVLHAYGTNGDSKGTFFYQGGAAGACGTVNSDSTPLVALPTSMYEGGKHCGKSVMIKNTANGKTVQAKVMDMCPGCPTATSLDLSVGAYDQIGDQATGVLPIVWGFM